MARTLWKGVVSFGLVSIPVRMSAAIKRNRLTFRYLAKQDLTPPKQVLQSQVTRETFGIKDTVKGYEYARGQYLPLTQDDFAKVPVRTTRAIEIHRFVEQSEIDPIFYETTHYLEPEELGAKPFELLREALSETNRVGIAKVALQKREHLCSLRPYENIMALHTLHWAEEIRPAENPAVLPDVKPEEMKMAKYLIEAMSGAFKPEEYRDEYQEALKAMVKAKLEGYEIKAPPEATIAVPDLMAALRQSIDQANHEKDKALS